MSSPNFSRRPLFLCFIISVVVVLSGVTSTARAQSTQLACSPCALDFGNVAVGGSQALAVTFTNSGTSAVTISGKDKNAPWFFFPRGLSLPHILGAGQSITFNMVFAPPTNRAASGSFTFHSTASNPDVVVSVTGTGVAAGTLSANPTSLGFGWVPIGASRTLTLTVTNPSSSALTFTQISNSGNVQASPFSTTGITPPLTLGSGQSITFQVTFTPRNQGDFFGNLSLVSSSGGQLVVAENGFGMAGGVLNVIPASLNFGSVTVGTSQSQTITLSAGAGQVTVSSDSLGSSEYSVSGLSLPLTLAAGQSAPVTVTFTPQASGAANSSLTFATGSGNTNPVLATLNGTGVSPAQHSVTLSWQPSSSQVVGYNVYRGSSASGPYSRVNSATDSSMTFSDDNVQSGNSYYYQVTSVDGNGVESVPSSPVGAQVPTP